MKLIKTIQNGTDSFRELSQLYIGAIATAAVLYSLFEHQGIFNSLWWAIVTALTVGYGDFYPHTVGGKIVGIALMHFVTLFIIPIIVARMAGRVISNRDQFTHSEQERIKKLLLNIDRKLATSQKGTDNERD